MCQIMTDLSECLRIADLLRYSRSFTGSLSLSLDLYGFRSGETLIGDRITTSFNVFGWSDDSSTAVGSGTEDDANNNIIVINYNNWYTYNWLHTLSNVVILEGYF